jgi:hypothetical protein
MNAPQPDTQKPAIFVDGKGYALDALSPEARAQLASLQFADGEVKRLQAQLAVANTAVNAYRNAFVALLPK